MPDFTVINVATPPHPPEVGVPWAFDPLDHFIPLGASMERLAMACGVLLFWLQEDDPRSALEQYDGWYQYGPIRESTGGVCAPDGIFTYPGDPPQYPMAKTILHLETVFIYQHSQVAIMQPNGSVFKAGID